MSHVRTRSWMTLIVVLVAAIWPAMAEHYYVNANFSDPNETNDGLDWTTAFGGPSALQRALEAVVNNNDLDDIIWVAGTTDPNQPAIYRPGSNRTDSFVIPNRLKIYGGFAGTETLEQFHLRNEFTRPTYLDGDIGTLNDASDNSYHVVTITEADHTTTKLSGFIIQNGNANGSDSYQYGGGIYLAGSDTTDGPSLDRLTIKNNKAVTAGGGVYSSSFQDWTYMTNCRFEYNSVTSSSGIGGALSTAGTAGVILQNCVFFDNESGGVGGALGLTGFKSFVANCTFNANTATGIELDGVRYGHSIYATALLSVYNTISWGNGASGLQFDSSSDANIATYFHNVKYSNIQTGSWSDEDGNFDPPVDPIFRDATEGVLTLCACSPCIDTGEETIDNSHPIPDEHLLQLDETDLDENDDTGEKTPWDIKDMERVIEYPDRGNEGAILDLGATEECPGDVDGDGDVDLTDLSTLLTAFGSTGCTTGACARANLVCDDNNPPDGTNDGAINLSDLAFLLSNFGTTCSPGFSPPGLTSGSVSTSVTEYDTSSYSGSGFEGEKHHFVFDVFCTIAESGDDWIGSGVTMTTANGATLRLVPNAGNPPTPGDSVPEKYTTFFGEPRAVNYSGRFTNPLPNGALVGKYTGSGAYTYTSTAINAAWYDMNASSNDGPAAVFRIVINVSGVSGADTSGGLGSVYFTTGSPGSGDIKVADMTFDVEHKYADSGSTVTVGSFYVTD